MRSFRYPIGVVLCLVLLAGVALAVAGRVEAAGRPAVQLPDDLGLNDPGLVRPAVVLLDGRGAGPAGRPAVQLPEDLGLDDPGLDEPDAAGREMEPGNYCVNCHLADDDRLAQASAWRGGIGAAQASSCPAVLRIQEELLYSEQLMLASDRLREDLGGRGGLEKIDAQLAAGQQGYSRLLDAPVDSLNAFVGEAQMLRFRMGKSYAALNGVLEETKKQTVLAGAALVTLVIAISLVWGLRSTQAAVQAGGSLSSGRRGWRRYRTPVLLSLAVFVFFALPIFRVPPAEVEPASAEEQAVQAALDSAGRAAEAASWATGRAWTIARVGAAWSGQDADQAGQALEEALQAAKEARLNAPALWGQSQAAQEISAGSEVNREKARLAARRLEAERSPVWGLVLIAGEWARIDPEQARAVLEEAALAAGQEQGVYRDLDLRLAAVHWARFDLARALALADMVADPALRAWGLREIAGISGEAAIYEKAAHAAGQVQDPLERARALREVAQASGDKALLEAARAALADAPEGEPLAFALAELAAAAEDAVMLQAIGEGHPEAKALGFYRLGQYEQAWQAAAGIANPYSRGRAQAAIAAAWGSGEAARLIEVPLYRDLALRDIALEKQDAALAQEIASPYYRVQVLTSAGEYDAAWKAAGALGEAYPLVALAGAWAESDPQAALEAVESMDLEVDKAEALRAIAAATGDQELFQRALSMALAARQRGDPLHPAQASLALALDFAGLNPDWAQAAFEQAYEAAVRIAVK